MLLCLFTIIIIMKILSLWKIVGFLIFVWFLLWGWYILDMFNIYWWIKLMHIRRNILFTIWNCFLLVALFRLFKYNHKGYILHTLWLMFIILWIKIPVLLRTIANRFHIVQLLYVGIIVTIVLEYIVIVTSIKKKSLMILSLVFILLQVILMYLLDHAMWEYVSLGIIPCLLLRWLWGNIFTLTAFTPNDKL